MTDFKYDDYEDPQPVDPQQDALFDKNYDDDSEEERQKEKRAKKNK